MTKSNFRSVSDDEYRDQFDIPEEERSAASEKLKEAYKRAWKTRNFEIDKLWTRATYFWGFVAAIFAGYISVMTSEHNCQALEMRLDLYLILLGIIFSFAWLFAIKGSKWWQVNWEQHINALEDSISGPLNKTSWYTTKGRRYSLSTIPDTLAWITIGVWVILLLQYLCKNRDGYTVSAIILMVVCVVVLHCRCLTGSDKRDIPEGKRGEFIRRDEDSPE